MPTDFTQSQQVALAIVPKVSASLSILGSTWIIIEVLTRKNKRQNVYNRLLCAMSFFDVTTAAGMFASTWPIPEDSEGIAFASGNQRSCEIQGFFLQMGTTPFLYNTCLAIYYLLVVKYNISEERLRSNVEPAMHIFSISFGLATSLTALFMDLYNDANLWCWISSYPHDCEGDECIRGRDDYVMFRWGYYFVPLWICAAIITVIMIVIYRIVHQREMKAITESDNLGIASPSTVRPSLAHHTPQHSFLVSGPSVQTQEQWNQTWRSEKAGRRQTMEDPSARCESLVAAQRPSMIMPRKMAEMFQSKKAGHFQTESEGADFVLKTIQSLPSAKEQALEMNTFGSRAVYNQALYYTCAFYATYTFASANRLTQEFAGETYFPILFLHAMLIPLKGLFNFMIYRHYFFIRLQQRNSHMPFWELIHLTCRWTFLGPPQEPKTVPENGGGSGTVAQIRNWLFLNGKASQRDGDDNPRDTSESEEGAPGSDSSESDDSGVVDDRGPNIFSDDVSGRDHCTNQPMLEYLHADLLMSYGDFPNILTEEPVMVTAEFPTMIGQDSYNNNNNIPESSLEDAFY